MAPQTQPPPPDPQRAGRRASGPVFTTERPRVNKPLVALAVALGVIGPLLIGAVLQMVQQQALGGVGLTEVPVQRVDFGSSVGTSGTIAPAQRLDLTFSGSGEVTAVNVAVGDTVTKGRELASIDGSRLRADAEDARAEANAAFEDYNRARRSGSSAEARALRSAYNAKNQALKEARDALDQTTLVSTIDGTVAAVNVELGDQVGSDAAGGPGGMAGGAAGGAGDPDVVVISSDAFVVEASVGSADRARVAKGMKATIKAASSPQQLTGTVTEVGVMAVAEGGGGGQQGAASFPLTVAIDGAPSDVFAGGSASIQILGEGRKQVLAIPQAALMGRTPDGMADVMVNRGDRQEFTQIRVGAEHRDMVEVLSGLNEGDLVVLLGGPAGVPGGAGEEPAPVESPR